MDRKTVFLQETHLVARNHRARCKSLEMEEMVRRLDRRISTLGLKVKRRFDEECSVIPMGGPLPVLGQPTVAYGAAAIMAHPASGYMINRVILQAPEVAAAMATSLRENGSPAEAAEAAWEAIWYIYISISLCLARARARVSLSLAYTRTHSHTHTRTHAHTHMHHTHTQLSLSLTQAQAPSD
jgi:lycopene cyclase-like protein